MGSRSKKKKNTVDRKVPRSAGAAADIKSSVNHQVRVKHHPRVTKAEMDELATTIKAVSLGELRMLQSGYKHARKAKSPIWGVRVIETEHQKRAARMLYEVVTETDDSKSIVVLEYLPGHDYKNSFILKHYKGGKDRNKDFFQPYDKLEVLTPANATADEEAMLDLHPAQVQRFNAGWIELSVDQDGLVSTVLQSDQHTAHSASKGSVHFIEGPPGTGKTLIAQTLVPQLIEAFASEKDSVADPATGDDAGEAVEAVAAAVTAEDSSATDETRHIYLIAKSKALVKARQEELAEFYPEYFDEGAQPQIHCMSTDEWAIQQGYTKSCDQEDFICWLNTLAKSHPAKKMVMELEQAGYSASNIYVLCQYVAPITDKETLEGHYNVAAGVLAAYLKHLNKNREINLALMQAELSPDTPMAEAIIWDEIQDTGSSLEFNSISSMLKDNGQLFGLGDQNQALSTKQQSIRATVQTWSKRQGRGDAHVHTLETSYRISQTACRLVNNCLEASTKVCQGVLDKHSYDSITSMNDQGKVAYCSGEEKDFVIHAERAGFAVLIFEQDTQAATEALRAKVSAKYGSKQVFTVKEAKGLEFDYTLLHLEHKKLIEINTALAKVNLKKKSTSARSKQRHDMSADRFINDLEVREMMNKLVVGLSRSKSHMAIVDPMGLGYLQEALTSGISDITQTPPDPDDTEVTFLNYLHTVVLLMRANPQRLKTQIKDAWQKAVQLIMSRQGSNEATAIEIAVREIEDSLLKGQLEEFWQAVLGLKQEDMPGYVAPVIDPVKETEPTQDSIVTAVKPVEPLNKAQESDSDAAMQKINLEPQASEPAKTTKGIKRKVASIKDSRPFLEQVRETLNWSKEELTTGNALQKEELVSPLAFTFKTVADVVKYANDIVRLGLPKNYNIDAVLFEIKSIKFTSGFQLPAGRLADIFVSTLWQKCKLLPSSDIKDFYSLTQLERQVLILSHKHIFSHGTGQKIKDEVENYYNCCFIRALSENQRQVIHFMHLNRSESTLNESLAISAMLDQPLAMKRLIEFNADFISFEEKIARTGNYHNKDWYTDKSELIKYFDMQYIELTILCQKICGLNENGPLLSGQMTLIQKMHKAQIDMRLATRKLLEQSTDDKPVDEGALSKVTGSLPSETWLEGAAMAQCEPAAMTKLTIRDAQSASSDQKSGAKLDLTASKASTLNAEEEIANIEALLLMPRMLLINYLEALAISIANNESMKCSVAISKICVFLSCHNIKLGVGNIEINLRRFFHTQLMIYSISHMSQIKFGAFYVLGQKATGKTDSVLASHILLLAVKRCLDLNEVYRLQMLICLIDKINGFYEAHPDYSPLHYAAKSSYVNVETLMSILECDLYSADHVDQTTGLTPLHVACLEGDYDKISALMEYNPRVMLSTNQPANCNAFAFLYDKVDDNPEESEHRYQVCKLMLAQADQSGLLDQFINELTSDGQSLLHLACRFGDLKVVQLLMYYEPIIQISDDGHVPLTVLFGNTDKSHTELTLQRPSAKAIFDFLTSLQPRASLLPRPSKEVYLEFSRHFNGQSGQYDLKCDEILFRQQRKRLIKRYKDILKSSILEAHPELKQDLSIHIQLLQEHLTYQNVTQPARLADDAEHSAGSMELPDQQSPILHSLPVEADTGATAEASDRPVIKHKPLRKASPL